MRKSSVLLPLLWALCAVAHAELSVMVAVEPTSKKDGFLLLRASVEKGLGQGNGGDFADEIDRTLGDPRSWIASRQFRLQRVPASAASEFTVYLASAKSSERMCNAGGLKTEGFTSCRLPSRK